MCGFCEDLNNEFRFFTLQAIIGDYCYLRDYKDPNDLEHYFTCFGIDIKNRMLYDNRYLIKLKLHRVKIDDNYLVVTAWFKNYTYTYRIRFYPHEKKPYAEVTMYHRPLFFLSKILSEYRKLDFEPPTQNEDFLAFF